MKHPWIVLATVAALSPGLAGAQSQTDQAAAAERAKLVTSVQVELGVPVDGKMGPKTHQAIEKFQRSKNLDPSGQRRRISSRARHPVDAHRGKAALGRTRGRADDQAGEADRRLSRRS